MNLILQIDHKYFINKPRNYVDNSVLNNSAKHKVVSLLWAPLKTSVQINNNNITAGFIPGSLNKWNPGARKGDVKVTFLKSPYNIKFPDIAF